MKKPQTVDEYIDLAAPDVATTLQQLRSLIRETAPEAEEKISYGIPYYGYLGRLVYFSFTKNHIGLYFLPPIIEAHQKDLRSYKTSTSVIQIPLGEKLPISLIKRLVKAAMKHNEQTAKKS